MSIPKVLTKDGDEVFPPSKSFALEWDIDTGRQRLVHLWTGETFLLPQVEEPWLLEIAPNGHALS